MEAALGPMAYDEPRRGFLAEQLGPERHYAQRTAREIDCAIRRRLEGALKHASAILEANRPLLKRASQRLLEAETLESEVLDELLAEARHLEQIERISA